MAYKLNIQYSGLKKTNFLASVYLCLLWMSWIKTPTTQRGEFYETNRNCERYIYRHVTVLKIPRIDFFQKKKQALILKFHRTV